MPINTLFFKYIKKTDIYLIITLNNNIIGNFIPTIPFIYNNKLSSLSSSLLKFHLLYRHLSYFGLVPLNNQKEFK